MAEPTQKRAEQGLPAVGEAPAGVGGLYREDLWSWVQSQVRALERRDHKLIDWDNLIEEVKDLGNNLERSWRSCCARVVEHMLKILHAHYADSFADWELDYSRARKGMIEALDDLPGIKGIMSTLHAKAWRTGRNEAIKELSKYDRKYGPRAARNRERELERLIPEECPWSLFDIAGCDPTDETAIPSKAVIPDEVRERLDMEEEIGYENQLRPVDRVRVAERQRQRDGDDAGGEDVEQSAERGRDEGIGQPLAELARETQERGGGRKLDR